MKKPLGLSIENEAPTGEKLLVLRFSWKAGEDVKALTAAFPREPAEQRPEAMAQFLINFGYSLLRKS